MKKLTYILGTFAGIVLSLVLFTTTAHAATFTVDSTADDSAVDPNVSCDTSNDECTLRSAIEAANAQAGADTIEFDISGGGVHTFTPASGYETITEQLIIDGTTQTGASCGTLVPESLPGTNTPHTLLIEIDASNIVSGNSMGFNFEGPSTSNSELRGVVVNSVIGATGVTIQGTNNENLITGMVVECNYLGTNPAGSVSDAGTDAGLGIYSSFTSQITIQNNLISGGWSGGLLISGENTIQDNLIGTNASGTSALANSQGAYPGSSSGASTFDHNVVSGNTSVGVDPFGQASITNNYIGLNIAGSPLGNGGDGVYLDSGIAGTVVSGNVISANSENGVHLERTLNCTQDTVDTTIVGNKIGTNVSGDVASGYGNGFSGVAANETENSCGGTVYQHRIGGDGAGEPNVIAGNTFDGVRVYQVNNEETNTDVFSIAVLTNSIFSNGNLGINLAADSNNSGAADVDLGPNAINSFLMSYPAGKANYYLNHPVINSVSYEGNQVTVNYNFQAPGVDESNPDAMTASDVVGFRLDFYVNSVGQDGAYNGYNQGKTHLGSFVVNGSETNATHTFTAPAAPTADMNVNSTSTVLWQDLGPMPECQAGVRYGSGPPYQISSGCG